MIKCSKNIFILLVIILLISCGSESDKNDDIDEKANKLNSWEIMDNKFKIISILAAEKQMTRDNSKVDGLGIFFFPEDLDCTTVKEKIPEFPNLYYSEYVVASVFFPGGETRQYSGIEIVFSYFVNSTLLGTFFSDVHEGGIKKINIDDNGEIEGWIDLQTKIFFKNKLTGSFKAKYCQ